MILTRLKFLIASLVIGLSTVYTAQTPNDSNITCLETKKVDFLAECYLRYKSLRVDTTLMGIENRKHIAIEHQQEKQKTDLADVIVVKDTAISKARVSYLDLVDKYAKKEKKLKFFKTTTVTFISTTAILILVFVALFKF